MSVLGRLFPYAERFGVNRRLPEKGRSRDEIVGEIRTMAQEEDAFWRTGKCSGTMYHGDLEHYEFLSEAFAPYAHTNVLQRDMCPSATRFESEIIAMALDLFHGAAVAEHHPDETPCGVVTSGGTDSIVSAVLAYRDHARGDRGIERPNLVLPDTAHPAFHKGAHMFGVETRLIAVDESTTVDAGDVAAAVDDQTIAIVGSAGNYPYGTVDPIGDLGEVASERGVGLHVDGCLGGYILPWGEALGIENIPAFDFRIPGVTSLSADTHKYGYGLKGTSTLLFRNKTLRQYQYFFQTDWKGGKYFSPGIAGSRSGGLLASAWASMVHLGREGYLERARGIFDTSLAMQAAVRKHAELRILGEPTFCFAFTSDDFDIYHVNDFMKERGWRFNGLQYPDALHFCVTGPQLQPGIPDTFGADLAGAVEYAQQPGLEAPKSGAVYGGVPGGHTAEAGEFIRAVMADLLDSFMELPPEE